MVASASEHGAEPRERRRHYIGAGEEDIRQMLDFLGIARIEDLYSHIPVAVRFKDAPAIPEELGYEELERHLQDLAGRNRLPARSFLGDGLGSWRVMDIVPFVLGLRELTTAYTPYQPERSQGTLISTWIYQCALAALSGFEAVNASMYDRATALYEAIAAALRLSGEDRDLALVYGTLYPGDLEVLHTLARFTGVRIEVLPADAATGTVLPATLAQALASAQGKAATVVFPHINTFGALEDVDAAVDLAAKAGVLSIAVVDPMTLGPGGLVPPAEFAGRGADFFVAEGQHLAIPPNFGGPGLGIFAVRYNEGSKNAVRGAPGRFVGDARDLSGRPGKVLILSAREQHIRRERATSNICTNQAFIATLAGAALLQRGDEGLETAGRAASGLARRAAGLLARFPGVALAFPLTPFYNAFTLRLQRPVAALIEAARRAGVHLGADVSARLEGNSQLLHLTFSDLHGAEDIAALEEFFTREFGKPAQTAVKIPELRPSQLRRGRPGLPRYDLATLKEYYRRLARQNVSPDFSIYPLGSCTMKYNPLINDRAAALPGFSQLHPAAPLADCQGALELLFEVQEHFKAIFGLPAVATQPLAGAQGELAGLKMFQAYHASRGESHRDILLIPRSAHGTNPATATVAGFVTREKRGEVSGVVLIEADAGGRIDMASLSALVAQHGPRLAGVMITNPNTSGIFESDFAAIADQVHRAGGLVYMDGANMNAIAGWVDLGVMGVDAVHNNTHKTWSIPHGGGGPGDAVVGVSARLAPFLPGLQVVRGADGRYSCVRPEHSMGSLHRHFGNFGHKVRLYTYLRRLGRQGVRRMSATAVLAARYLYRRLAASYPALPAGSEATPRMHEFILTLPRELFAKAERAGLQKSEVIPRVGKLFLDYGFHAPTVAFPEVFGIMIEPTESYSKAELDRFAEAVLAIYGLVDSHPEVLLSAPHFTPVDRIDDVAANRRPVFSGKLDTLPEVLANRRDPREIGRMSIPEITAAILAAHERSRGAPVPA